MPLPTTTITTILSLFTTTHHFSTTTATSLPRLKIPSKYRQKAIKHAQESITEYLHSTRSIPFSYAELIVKNATFSLSLIISQVPFHHSSFLSSIQRFLRYHPINEFEFFYESIGIEYKEIKEFLPVNKFFLKDDKRVFSNACALADFGFPWNKLGVLCRGKDEIFSSENSNLRAKLGGFRDCYGFSNAVIVGICLVFPRVLSRFGGSEELLSGLKRVLMNTDLVNRVEGNVDVTYAVCRKIRLFYKLGCKMGEVGELLVKNRNVFVDYAEDDLVRKIEFFCRLGVDKEQVGLLLLSKPDILKFDLDDRVITVLSLLKHFNLSTEKLKHVEQNYPYVLGKNRMVNVSHIIRAMDLSEWFFNKVKCGDHTLLATYTSSNQCESTDDDYRNYLQKILTDRYRVHTTSKLDFLHSIGFGENKFTVKVLRKLSGTSSKLYERFNFLLSVGIKFSKLCKMIHLSPKILNQNTCLLEKKVKFLCEGMASSLEYLDEFPAYLNYDLENRIKPRFKFHVWVKAQGWCRKEYTVASLIATSEKQFIARISDFHPDATKKWFEYQKERRKQVAEKS
ncbi:hypothetical protein Leryth_014874 [Lithospermum erythrorhizon]|nr:hypothetical protein Leryth_014874 [Lithospermum erythrorhizon]